MEPGLKEGDRILTSGDVSSLQRGDIILFYYPKDESKTYIKRVIGLPGEVVEVREGQVLINGQAIEEPYVLPQNNLSKFSELPKQVPPDSYYVMGDNRDNSSDSRYWGTVPRKLVYGKFLNKY